MKSPILIVFEAGGITHTLKFWVSANRATWRKDAYADFDCFWDGEKFFYKGFNEEEWMNHIIDDNYESIVWKIASNTYRDMVLNEAVEKAVFDESVCLPKSE